MNPAIPDALREFVQTRVAEGGYASVDEYLGRLVEADQEQSARERLEEELLHGLAGERVPVTAEEFDRLREEIRGRYADKDDRRCASARAGDAREISRRSESGDGKTAGDPLEEGVLRELSRGRSENYSLELAIVHIKAETVDLKKRLHRPCRDALVAIHESVVLQQRIAKRSRLGGKGRMEIGAAKACRRLSKRRIEKSFIPNPVGAAEGLECPSVQLEHVSP